MKRDKWIKLVSGIHEDLKGKVVDTYAFSKGFDDVCEESHLIIKFTDGTFICVGAIESDYSDYSVSFDNKYCPEGYAYREVPHYFTIDGKLILEDYFKDRIDIGVIKPIDENKIQILAQEKKNREKKHRYEEFLKLKKEFEPENC